MAFIADASAFPILAEYCLPLVRVGGLFIAAKGHDPEVVFFYSLLPLESSITPCKSKLSYYVFLYLSCTWI